jgi:cation transport regulator
MPYENTKELPDSLREHLPAHAQEIYRAAFNSAWEEYHHDEERAHRVAWAAVEKKFKKDAKSGNWEPIGGK